MDKGNVAYIHNGYHSVIKKNTIMSFVRKYMEVELIMVNEINRLRKTSIACFLSCADSLKKHESGRLQWYY
jgi:hypothetical protein